MRILVLIGVLGAATPALAQSSEEKAAAAAAFDAGKQLDEAGKTAEACEQFARSQQLDPQYGTQYNLALCYQKLGKLASAYGEFDELAGTDSNVKRRKKSKEYAAALKKRLTSLTLVVTDPAPSLVVKRDDTDVTLMVGVTTPVDPGVYTFEASAPNYRTWSQKVDLTAEGATITVDIPPLEPATDVTPDVTGDEPIDPPSSHRSKTPGAKAKSGGGGRKLAGMITAGAGLVGTGVGLFFGYQAMSLTGDAKDLCNGQLNPCSGDSATAQERIDDARGKAMLSNIVTGVGVAALAAGLVIWLTAPDGGTAEHTALVPTVGQGTAGLVLDGRF